MSLAIVAMAPFGERVAISVVEASVRVQATKVVVAITADAVVVETVAIVRAQLATASDAACANHATGPGITTSATRFVRLAACEAEESKRVAHDSSRGRSRYANTHSVGLGR